MRTPSRRFEIRKIKVRSKIAKTTNRLRLSVCKSGRHVYAQIIDDERSVTIAYASTLDEKIRKLKKSNCNIESATKVGELIGERAAQKGVSRVVFDRGGDKYHGVIKSVADGARKRLEF
jgi:large subunit ribosomal protein L18